MYPCFADRASPSSVGYIMTDGSLERHFFITPLSIVIYSTHEVVGKEGTHMCHHTFANL
jgi:hypothetical protein